MKDLRHTISDRWRRITRIVVAAILLALSAAVLLYLLGMDQVLVLACIGIAAAAAAVLFVLAIWMRWFARCPECGGRLRVVHLGWNETSAVFRCRRCRIIYDMGVSFRGDG